MERHSAVQTSTWKCFMITQLAQAMAARLAAYEFPTVSRLCLSYLNPDALYLEHLFIPTEPVEDTTRSSGLLPEEDILVLILKFAPLSLCEQVMTDIKKLRHEKASNRLASALLIILPLQPFSKEKKVALVQCFLNAALRVPLWHAFVPTLLKSTIEVEIEQLCRAYHHLWCLEEGVLGKMSSHIQPFLGIKFAGGRTLLHEALYRNCKIKSQTMIEFGADCLTQDDSGVSAFDLALSLKFDDVLSKMISQQATVLCGKGLKGVYEMGSIVRFEQALEALGHLDEEVSREARTELLNSLPIHLPVTLDGDGQALGRWHTEPFSWINLAKTSQNLQLLFLLNLAEACRENLTSTMDAALIKYMERVASYLSSTQDELMEISLMGFFFSMTIQSWLQWLEKVSERLTFSTQNTLKRIFFKALFKPSLFSSLTLNEQIHIFQYFKTETDFIHDCLGFHFRYTSLLRIHPTRLLTMLDFFSFREGVRIWSFSQDSMLYMALLSRIKPKELPIYPALSIHFDSALVRFESLALPVLFHCLNIARGPAVYQLYVQRTKEMYKPRLRAQWLALYEVYAGSPEILSGTLLQHIFLRLTGQWVEMCCLAALERWFATASSAELGCVLKEYDLRLDQDERSGRESIWLGQIGLAVWQGLLRNSQVEQGALKWVRLELRYAKRADLFIEKLSLYQFPTFTKVGKKILQYCQEEMQRASESHQRTLLKYMGYFSEWQGVQPPFVFEERIAARMQGFASLLNDYQTPLDITFGRRWFEVFVPVLQETITQQRAFLAVLIGMIQLDTNSKDLNLITAIGASSHEVLIEQIISAAYSHHEQDQEQGQFLLRWLLKLMPKQMPAYATLQRQLGSERLHLLRLEDLIQTAHLEELKGHACHLGRVFIHLLHRRKLGSFYLESNLVLDKEKCDFLEICLVRDLENTDITYEFGLWEELTIWVAPERVLQLLSSSSIKKENVFLLWDACLASTSVREWLLARKEEVGGAMLCVDKDDRALKNHLLERREVSWFIDGLSLLLGEACLPRLMRALEGLQDDKSNAQAIPRILEKLIQTEAGVKLWFEAIKRGDLKQWKEQFLFYFDKSLVLAALNGTQKEDFSLRQQALLEILASQHDRLFRRKEIRLARSAAWLPADLVKLVRFASHPEVCKTKAGERLLAELVFRCANFGVCEYWYDQWGHLNHALIKHCIPRADLERLAPESELYLSSYDAMVKEDVRAGMDWQKMMDTTWDTWAYADKLPIFSAFLWNYEGQTAPLRQLLEEYALSVIQRRGQLDLLSGFVAQFPQHPVSRVIELVLRQTLEHVPYLLSKTVFNELTQSTLYNHGDVCAWLHFWGERKCYALVQRCCEMELATTESSKKQFLEQVRKEASVEGELVKHVGYWYFNLLAFFKRLWHYGFSAPTGVVVFAEHSEQWNEKDQLPKLLRYSEHPGQFVVDALNINKCHSQLLNMKSRIQNLGSTQSSGFTLFQQDAVVRRNPESTCRPGI